MIHFSKTFYWLLEKEYQFAVYFESPVFDRLLILE